MEKPQERLTLKKGVNNGTALSIITENNMICEREINKLIDLQDWVEMLKHVPK